MGSPTSREQYGQEQEAFVSNHGGTTPQEIIFTLLPSICSVLLTTTTLGVTGKSTHKNVKVVIEFLLIVIPIILCCTILSEHISIVCITMISISIVNITLLGSKKIKPSLTMRSITVKRPFITNFRALINIITSICILAIDFQAFPRKFAKTEVFGYSLMDTGAGLFILSNALVAPEARDFTEQYRQVKFHETLKNMKNCIQSCIPLLVLGFGRFVAVEYTGYQKHITEYGIHWNFFLTLATVKLFISMITSTINSKYSLLSGIWILGMHEYIMNTKDLKRWILSDAPRNDFFSANREGLISVPGYIGLYFIGVAVGRLIHSTYKNSQAEYMLQQSHKSISLKIFGFEIDANYNESMVLCIKLSLISAQACIATLYCDSYFKVSRRLANAGYCMWILTLATTLLTLLLLIEIVLDITNYVISDLHYESTTEKPRKNLPKNARNEKQKDKDDAIKKTLEIFDAVNYNGLFFFLLSNVMTGLINISIYTLYIKQSMTLLILIMYMVMSVFLTLILYRLQIRIKL